ncbi:MAG TPA: hypothetical protein VIM33_02865, partial [Gaiellaceae bacterium]
MLDIEDCSKLTGKRARRLIEAVVNQCTNVLIYAYPDWGQLQELAETAGLHLGETNRLAGLLALRSDSTANGSPPTSTKHVGPAHVAGANCPFGAAVSLLVDAIPGRGVPVRKLDRAAIGEIRVPDRIRGTLGDRAGSGILLD